MPNEIKATAYTAHQLKVNSSKTCKHYQNFAGFVSCINLLHKLANCIVLTMADDCVAQLFQSYEWPFILFYLLPVT